MAKLKPISPEPSEASAVQEIIKKGSDWRERHPAATIVRLASGQRLYEVSAQQGWCEETVRIRRRK